MKVATATGCRSSHTHEVHLFLVYPKLSNQLKNPNKMSPLNQEFPLQGGESHLEVFKEDWYKLNKFLNKKNSQKQQESKQNYKHRSNKKRRKNRKCKPQLGFEELCKCNAFTSFDNLLSAIKLYSGIKDIDTLVHHIEAFAALCVSVSDATSIAGIISSVIMYAKIHIDGSLILSLKDYLHELLMEQQGPGSDFVECVRDIRDNWRKVKKCNNFGRLSQLLGVVVSMGFCSLTSLDFSIAGFKLFDTKMIKVHENCVDIFDATLESIAFLVDGAYECFQQKSLQPLLVDDVRAVEMDDEYAFILSAWNLVVIGSAREQLNLDNNEFDHRLEKLIGKMKQLLPSLKGYDKKIISDKIFKLVGIKNDFVTMQISSGVRPAPFTIEAFGESSQGKTTILDQVIDALLRTAGLDTDKSRQATINASDKFMSTWRNDNLVAKLDDMCNTKSSFVEKAPTQWVIDLCNNEPFYAPKADLDSKGKVFVQPEIVTISTNKKDLDAYTYSHCPYSIQRRAHLVITVRAKAIFQRSHEGVLCGIDHDKVAQYARDHPNDIYDDIWDVDIEQAVKPEELQHIADYAPYVFKGKKMMNVSMQQLLEVCIYEFHKHRKHQEAIVGKMRARNKTVCTCGHILEDGSECLNIKGMCSLHDTDYKPLPNTPIIEDVPDEDEDEYDSDDGFYESCIFGLETPAELNKRRRRREKKKQRMKKQFGLDSLKQTICRSNIVESMRHRNYVPDAPKQEFGVYTANMAASIIPDAKTCWSAALVSMEVATTTAIYEASSRFFRHFDWLSLLPSCILNTRPFNFFMNRVIANQSLERIRKFQTYGTFTCAVGSSLLYSKGYNKSLAAMPIVWLGSQMLISSGVKKYVRAKLIKRADTCSPIVRKVKQDYGVRIVQGCAALGALMLIRAAYKKYLAAEPQGNIVDPNAQEVAERDSEENPWASLIVRPADHSSIAKTTTIPQMQTLINKNLMYMSIQYDDVVGKACALFLRTNYFVLPYHYIAKQNSFVATFYKENADKVGGSFKERIEPTTTYRIPNTDLCIIYCATGGSFKDLTPYLLNDCPYQHSFNMVYRHKTGKVQTGDGLAEARMVDNGFCKFNGLLYKNLSFNTFEGLCGAVLYSCGQIPSITGFHVGGINDRPYGCAARLSRNEWNVAFQHFKDKNFTVQTGCEGLFREVVLGQTILTGQTIPKKSPMNFLPKEATIEYRGRCIGAISPHTDAVKTSIIKYTEELLGPNPYRPPKIRPEWWPWQQCLSNLAIPSNSLPYDLVERSVDNYLEPLLIKVERPEWKCMKPLEDKENLLGIKGLRFVDAIKKNTAIGAPLTGPKSNYMTPIAPTDDYPDNFVLDDEIMEEIRYYESEYKCGRRVYSLIKATTKDEIHTKDKCRIFYVNNIALTWMIRKYYLPIIRFLQMFPTLSECAVGVNSESQEWQQLDAFMKRHPNLIGGDYSKYDQKIPAQLILAGFKILTLLARRCNYSEEDIFVMETLAADVAYAYVMFNGDLVSYISGSHISGNSLTVIINGLVGALNLRCAFYHYNPDVKDYREHCCIMTYGDDNAGSYSNKVKFGIKPVHYFLADYGQVYTMPDKESELADTLNPDDFEFLKRRTVYIPEIDCKVGALSEKSMVKDLYMRVPSGQSDLSEDQLMAQNIDGVIRDAFFHGRQKYEYWRSLMKTLAQRSNLTHKCTLLNSSFDDKVHDWKMRYVPSYKANHVEEEVSSFLKFSTYFKFGE
jgi:hypothetical protein